MHCIMCVCSRLKRESGTNFDAEQLLQQKEHEVVVSHVMMMMMMSHTVSTRQHSAEWSAYGANKCTLSYIQ